jgi:hypothetical protein
MPAPAGRPRGTRSVHFCIDLGLRERRDAVAPTARGWLARGASSAVKIRPLPNPSVDFADSPNRSPAQPANSPGRFPRGTGTRNPDTRSGVLRRALPIGSRPNRSISAADFPLGRPQMLTCTHLEGWQWVREPLFPNPSWQRARPRLPRRKGHAPSDCGARRLTKAEREVPSRGSRGGLVDPLAPRRGRASRTTQDTWCPAVQNATQRAVCVVRRSKRASRRLRATSHRRRS